MRLHVARRAAWGLAVALCAAGGGCDDRQSATNEKAPAGNTSAVPPETGAGVLVDITQQAGIRFIHRTGATGEFFFPEITGSGCGFLDIDNDGWLDIYFVQSGRLVAGEGPAPGNVLYRNRGDGTFEDITAASGAGDIGYGQGLAVGDYDNDGFTDIYVQNYGPDVLLRNNGDGTFADVTAKAGIANSAWTIGGAFVDIDNDGWLDIYASNYVDFAPERNVACTTPNTGERDYCGPNTYTPVADALFRNNRDGTFTDISEAAGLKASFGPGMSAIGADFDDDGAIDIYVGNDSAANQLWRNLGGGRFAEVAQARGCAVNGMGREEASMGCNAEDFDGDGRLDLFMCHYFLETHTLFLNRGAYFEDITPRTGLGPLSLHHTGFGACVFDLFNDGGMCLYIANGGVSRPGGPPPDPALPMAEYDQVLQWSAGSMKFTDLSERMGSALKALDVSRGVAVGDYDNDGDMDVLVSANNGPGRLLRNDAPGGHHWLMVKCLDAAGRRDAIGAKVFVTVGGVTRRRDLIVNYSYACASDPRLHFGLGSAVRADSVRVRWPDGTEAAWEQVLADQVFMARHPGAGSRPSEPGS